MAKLSIRGKTGHYGINYNADFGSIDVSRQGKQTRTTVTKPMSKGVTLSASGGRKQATTIGVSKTKNNLTFGASATPKQKRYGISVSKGFK